MGEVELRRRSPSERLRYFADRLLDDPTETDVTAAALQMVMVADELDAREAAQPVRVNLSPEPSRVVYVPVPDPKRRL